MHMHFCRFSGVSGTATLHSSIHGIESRIWPRGVGVPQRLLDSFKVGRQEAEFVAPASRRRYELRFLTSHFEGIKQTLWNTNTTWPDSGFNPVDGGVESGSPGHPREPAEVHMHELPQLPARRRP